MINYTLVDKILFENLGKPATEISKIYIDLDPLILNNMNPDSVRRNIAWYMDYKKGQFKEYTTSPESMVLLISDIHFGKLTYSLRNPNEIDYNSEVAKIRIDTIGKAVSKIYSVISKSYYIDALYVFNLGDFIDGELTYPSQQTQIDSPEFKQILSCADSLGNIYDNFANIFPKVIIRSVAGNHAHNPHMNPINRGDVTLYEILRRDYQKNSKIDFSYSDTFYFIERIKNTGFLLYHGHSVRSFWGIPYYGIQRWGSQRIKSLGQDWDYLLMGHLHIYSDLSFPSFQAILNGTLVTSDSFVLEHFGRDGDCKFHLFGVHSERGITFRYGLSGI